MIWVSFAMVLVKLVLEFGPEIWEILQKIFTRWQTLGTADRLYKREAKLLTAAMKSKLLAKLVPDVGPAGCPLEEYLAGLDKRVMPPPAGEPAAVQG